MIEVTTRELSKQPSTEKPNAVIWYLAVRPSIIDSLRGLYEHFNNQYKYPVIIFTFGQPYSKAFISKIHRTIDPAIRFVKVKPRIPANVPESELFYNRKDIRYVRKNFPETRIGYLHMCHFMAGGFLDTKELDGYDWGMRLDDDSFFLEDISFDFFRVMRDGRYLYGTGYENDRELAPKRSVNDCTSGLWEFTDAYMKKNSIESDWIQRHRRSDGSFHYVVGAGNMTLWNLNLFRSPEWRSWWKTLLESGGIYKYRWGDQEIHRLFMQMQFKESEWKSFAPELLDCRYKHESVPEKRKYWHGGLGMWHTKPHRSAALAEHLRGYMRNLARALSPRKFLASLRPKQQMNLTEMGRRFHAEKADPTRQYFGKCLTEIYEPYLTAFCGKPIKLLEIGVARGKSLRMWAKYFPQAKIFGLDINPITRKYERGRIRIIIGSQNDPNVLDGVSREAGTLDIIIDDGSHVNTHILQSFETLFPKLNSGGVYIIEALHCSYQDLETAGGIGVREGSRQGLGWSGMHLNPESESFTNHREDMDRFFLERIKQLDHKEGSIQSIHFWSRTCIITKV
ncbi:MAG: class I SAM-dependent methyltransferase [Candidatus Omnitrophota bacterium]|nr:class I SAM-dependent methyltransferase [Candidatus Omnitrophota bacterium]